MCVAPRFHSRYRTKSLSRFPGLESFLAANAGGPLGRILPGGPSGLQWSAPERGRPVSPKFRASLATVRQSLTAAGGVLPSGRRSRSLADLLASLPKLFARRLALVWEPFKNLGRGRSRALLLVLTKPVYRQKCHQGRAGAAVNAVCIIMVSNRSISCCWASTRACSASTRALWSWSCSACWSFSTLISHFWPTCLPVSRPLPKRRRTVLVDMPKAAAASVICISMVTMLGHLGSHCLSKMHNRLTAVVAL